MIVRLLACLLVLLALPPREAAAAAVEREGIVAILPAARWGQGDVGIAPKLGLSFGIRALAALEVGVDVAASRASVHAEGRDNEFFSLPLLLRGSWTPTPQWDLRPVVHAGIGKALVIVDGGSSKDREHTPQAFMAAAGIQADLSESVGMAADVGYLHLRTNDPKLGSLDGGGPFVRAGVYFRWEPVRRLGR